MQYITDLIRDYPMASHGIGELLLGIIAVLLIPSAKIAIIAMLFAQAIWTASCGYLSDSRLVTQE